jgi:hypothetical protein
LPQGMTRPQPASSASSCSDAFVSGSGLSTGPRRTLHCCQFYHALTTERPWL